MGFFDKIKKGLEKTRRQMGGLFAEFTGENEEFYEELEDSLILADAGAAAASRAVAQLREKVRDETAKVRIRWSMLVVSSSAPSIV